MGVDSPALPSRFPLASIGKPQGGSKRHRQWAFSKELAVPPAPSWSVPMGNRSLQQQLQWEGEKKDGRAQRVCRAHREWPTGMERSLS